MKKLIVLLMIICFGAIILSPAQALVALDENGDPIPSPKTPMEEPDSNNGPTSLQPGKVDSDKGNKGKPGPKKVIIELSQPGKGKK